MTGDAAVSVEETTTGPRTAKPSLWVFALIGIGGAALGLLPWLLGGARVPMQNLWTQVPDDIPIALLPFHPYASSHLLALLIIGAAVAGVAGRAVGTGRVRGAAPVLVAAVALSQLTAVLQSALATRSTLPDRTESDIWVAAIAGGALAAVAAGILVAALIARAPRAGALIGLTLGAIPASSWVSSLFAPYGALAIETPQVLALTPWVTPILVGAAIAWTGLHTPGRIVAAVAALLLLWIVPAAITGMWNAVSGRAMWRDVPGMIEHAHRIFFSALLIPELALRSLVAAIITATVGLAIRLVIVRRRTR